MSTRFPLSYVIDVAAYVICQCSVYIRAMALVGFWVGKNVWKSGFKLLQGDLSKMVKLQSHKEYEKVLDSVQELLQNQIPRNGDVELPLN